tara:strand:+ start:93 stop:863 length:771 start_codon:yes stop_codon:yes gene_type:complete
MHPSLALAIALSLTISSPASANASLDTLIAQGGDALLAEADRRANIAPDITRQVKMVLTGGDDNGNELMMEQITKDGKGTAIRFSKPADLKGLALVIKGEAEIYVKLPGSKKVRRVAAHARKQGFQGTDFSLDDLKMLRFVPHYSAKLSSSEGTTVELELTRRPTSDIPYYRLIMTMDKDILIPKTIAYFDKAGKKIKLQQRSELAKFKNGGLTYRNIKMTDLVRNHSTELLVLEEDIEKNIPSRTFSKRWLLRGS